LPSFLFGLLDIVPVLFQKPGLVAGAVNNRRWIPEQRLMWSDFIVVVNPLTYAGFCVV
jgi:hypothetical protein